MLITGVRGKTGLPLASLLAVRLEVEVLGGSSDPSGVSIGGVRPTAFSWDEPAGWAAAVDGADAAFVVRPDRADAPELVDAFLRETGTGTRIVLLSERSPEAGAPWAVRVEDVVRASGRPWTLLRPSWFMQVLTDPRFLLDAIAGGELPFPAGEAQIAWIDARDIAAVAERALLEDGHAGQAYELSGPQALTLPETAALLSASTGHPVRHVDLTIEAAVAGEDGFERELNVTTYERVQAGVFAGITGAVATVTGRPAGTLEQFLGSLPRG